MRLREKMISDIESKQLVNTKTSEKRSQSKPFFSHHSRRMQYTVVFLFFACCFVFLFVLEARLANQQKQLEFAYKEFYLKPFHYKLDPFSYVEIKNGIPITEPEPPNPHFMFSFEEQLLNRFIDYYLWIQGPTDESDITTDPDRMPLTIQAFGGHVRNRLYYRLERDELKINPILLTGFALPQNIGAPEDIMEPNKLLWNVVPYCSDRILEESLHELGNIHGFLYARGNHMNFRFLNQGDSATLSNMISHVPVKLAYLHHHNFINFTRHGYKKPISVTIVCEPIDKKLRHFYTERYNYKEWSEDFPVSKSRWWAMTLDECMKNDTNRECRYKGVQNIKRRSALDIGRTWLPRRVEWTSPQFCEYDRCNSLGDEEDLDYAKHVLDTEYTVVGKLENLDETMDLLEAKVPHFFKGIKNIYYQKLKENPKVDPPGLEIPPITQALKEEMETRFAPEIDFYKFASKRFDKDIEALRGRDNARSLGP